MRLQWSVLKFAKEKQYMNLHPTQKPVALFEYLVLTYTNKGDIGFENNTKHGFFDTIYDAYC